MFWMLLGEKTHIYIVFVPIYETDMMAAIPAFIPTPSHRVPTQLHGYLTKALTTQQGCGEGSGSTSSRLAVICLSVTAIPITENLTRLSGASASNGVPV